MKEERHQIPELRAAFSAAAYDCRVCTIVVDPTKKRFSGEKLEAILKTAAKEYLVVQVVVDDVLCDDDPVTAKELGDKWLEEHYPDLKAVNISFERVQRWSTLQEDEYYGQKRRDITGEYKRNGSFRSVVNSILVKQEMAETGKTIDSLVNVRDGFKKLAERFAGLAAFSATPVISSWTLPDDPRILERSKHPSHCPNSLVFPELLEVTYFEAMPAQPKAEPVQEPQHTAEVVSLADYRLKR